MVRTRARTRPEVARPRPLRCLALLVAMTLAGTVHAQTFRIQPTLGTQLTWTDNVDLNDADPQQDWILEVSPGVSVVRESGRFSGGLDLSLRSLSHVERTEDNTTFIALDGRGEFEAIEDALFVDFDASVSRDNQSAFVGRLPGDGLDVDENNETRVFSLTPRFTFHFGAGGQGEVLYRERWLDGGSGGLDRQRSQMASVGLADPSAFRLFGWGVDFSRTQTTYDSQSARDLEQDDARATLFVNLDPQFRLRAIAGYESNDYAIEGGDDERILGAGFDWYPTERTALSATGEKRIFGNGYDVSLRHRMARSSLSFTARRDISSLADDIAGGYVIDPLYQVLYQALAVERPELSALERERIALRAYRSLGGASIRSNAYYLLRTVGASWSLVGVRNTLTVGLQRSERDQLDALSGFAVGDELNTYESVSTRSFNVSLSHRLSGLATLNASYLRSRSSGSGDTNDTANRSSATLGVSREIGVRTSGTLMYRHTRSEGSDDYTENAVTATLGMRF